ncbi:MAG: hypothetical protein Q8L86_04720 [Vicinamibacterales bacterium]|nr:hypothetical protein [Vicinamibacterales bacterium]
MRMRTGWIMGLLLWALGPGGGPALARQTPVDVEKIGPQVGARVPDFSGTDQRGRTQTLQSLMGREGLMLVFNRSADW